MAIQGSLEQWVTGEQARFAAKQLTCACGCVNRRQASKATGSTGGGQAPILLASPRARPMPRVGPRHVRLWSSKVNQLQGAKSSCRPTPVLIHHIDINQLQKAKSRQRPTPVFVHHVDMTWHHAALAAQHGREEARRARHDRVVHDGDGPGALPEQEDVVLVAAETRRLVVDRTIQFLVGGQDDFRFKNASPKCGDLVGRRLTQITARR